MPQRLRQLYFNRIGRARSDVRNHRSLLLSGPPFQFTFRQITKIISVLNPKTYFSLRGHITLLYYFNRTKSLFHSPIFRFFTTPTINRPPCTVANDFFFRQEKSVINTSPNSSSQYSLAIIHTIPHLIQQNSPHIT